MSSKIWNKYTKLNEINSNSNFNIKTYLARIEPIIKEINIPKDNNEYNLITEKIENIKNMNGIIEIIKEDNKIYIVIENKDEIISKINGLILEIEGILGGQVNELLEVTPNYTIPSPITEGEINVPIFTQNLDQELEYTQITPSALPEITTTDYQPETTYTNQDNQNKNTITFEQTVSSFEYKNNPTFSPNPPVQVIPDTSFQQISSSIQELDLQQTSVNSQTYLKNTNNYSDSNIAQTSLNQVIDSKQNIITTNPIEQQPINFQQMSVIPPVNEDIILPPSSVPHPATLTMTSNSNNPGALAPPESKVTEITKIYPKAHTRSISAIQDEDFHRRRPIYDEYQFNEDRYRGFRFGSNFFKS